MTPKNIYLLYLYYIENNNTFQDNDREITLSSFFIPYKIFYLFTKYIYIYYLIIKYFNILSFINSQNPSFRMILYVVNELLIQ